MGFQSSGGGQGAISTSGDVSLNNPTNNQVLGYDSATAKWQNSTAGGYIINAQVGTSYTLTLSDTNKFITFSNSSASTVTIPTNANVAFPIGTSLKFAQIGSGQLTVVGASGVSVVADPGLKIAARYGGAELIKLATNSWLLVGRLSA